MLNISKAQLDTLDDLMEARYETRLREEIAKLFPENMSRLKQLPDGEKKLAEFMNQVVTRAERYDMEADGDVASYIAFTLARATLDRTAAAALEEWVRPILDRENTPGNVRMALIELQLKSLAERDPNAARLYGVTAAMRKAFG